MTKVDWFSALVEVTQKLRIIIINLQTRLKKFPDKFKHEALYKGYATKRIKQYVIQILVSHNSTDQIDLDCPFTKTTWHFGTLSFLWCE